MAVQYQLAHSSEVVGAGIFAGGPYYCAQGQEGTALSACMSYPDLIDVGTLVSDAQNYAQDGAIDALSNLADHNVYVFSGQNDKTVYPGVVKKLVTMYQDLGVKNVVTNFTTEAGHSFPTTDFGNPCGTTQSPYITNCDFDGAGALLKTIYGDLKPKVRANQQNIKKMSLSPFTPNNVDPASIGLDKTVYYYEPSKCNKASNCTVHISLAGCQMTYNDIGLDWVTSAGYNGWAESNNIVVLYPFTIKTFFNPGNPEGCWDWWGYVSADYTTKTGAQIETLHNLVAFFQ